VQFYAVDLKCVQIISCLHLKCNFLSSCHSILECSKLRWFGVAWYLYANIMNVKQINTSSHHLQLNYRLNLLMFWGGYRQVSIRDFFIDGENCMQSDEVLVGIEIPFTDEVCVLCGIQWASVCALQLCECSCETLFRDLVVIIVSHGRHAQTVIILTTKRLLLLVYKSGTVCLCTCNGRIQDLQRESSSVGYGEIEW